MNSLVVHRQNANRHNTDKCTVIYFAIIICTVWIKQAFYTVVHSNAILFASKYED